MVFPFPVGHLREAQKTAEQIPAVEPFALSQSLPPMSSPRSPTLHRSPTVPLPLPSGSSITMSPEAQACLCSGSGVHMGVGGMHAFQVALHLALRLPSLGCVSHTWLDSAPSLVTQGLCGTAPSVQRDESPLAWSPYL